MHNKNLVACLCAFALGVSALGGQEPPAALPPVPRSAVEVAPSPQEAPAPKPATPDPTVPTPKMQEMLQVRNATGPASTKFPSITLKGRVLSKLRAPVVLLDIDGKSYAVGQGVAIMSANNQIIKVVEITAIEVKIQVDGSTIFALN